MKTKMIAIVGFLCGLLGLVGNANAGTYYTSQSTNVLVSSGPFGGYNMNVIGVSLSSTNVSNFNVHYLVMYDTDSFGRTGVNCTNNFNKQDQLTPPLFFASSVPVSAATVVIPPASGGYVYYPLPGNGLTIEKGLYVCQEGGSAGGGAAGIGGTFTLYFENQAKSRRPY